MAGAAVQGQQRSKQRHALAIGREAVRIAGLPSGFVEPPCVIRVPPAAVEERVHVVDRLARLKNKNQFFGRMSLFFDFVVR